MFRWFFKLILLAAAAALVYGLWLLYQEKSPEEKAGIRGGCSRGMKSAGKTVTEAGQKVVEKGKQAYEDYREGERE
ncbi:MAG: hypothetical protein P9M08_03150 [Candidatus Erginobacter occultus]|nr:hypothetical protein [Candidatus Erginobacter occultus]